MLNLEIDGSSLLNLLWVMAFSSDEASYYSQCMDQAAFSTIELQYSPIFYLLVFSFRFGLSFLYAQTICNIEATQDSARCSYFWLVMFRTCFCAVETQASQL